MPKRSDVKALADAIYSLDPETWPHANFYALLHAAERMRRDHYPQGDEPSAAAKAWDRAKARLLRG